MLNIDLYGRGYSDTPDPSTTPYTAELYTTQLALLMQKIGWEKANVVGLSMVCIRTVSLSLPFSFSFSVSRLCIRVAISEFGIGDGALMRELD